MRLQLFIGCLIFINLSSFCQTTDSIIDPNKIWYTYIYIYCCEQVNTEVLGIGNDTTINDTTYYTVLRSTGGITIPLQNYGLIREDNNKIYYKTSAEKPEYLIYDFSILEEDTVTVYGLSDWTTDKIDEFKYKCDSIRIREYYQVQ